VTEYQLRVDERLDLYPVNRRWHHLPTQERGHYTSALQVARRFLRANFFCRCSGAGCDRCRR
jgi:hypothetical protein